MSKHGCFIYTVEGLNLMRCYSVLLALCARKLWIARPIWNTEKNNDILCVINQQELRRSYSSHQAIFAFNVAGLVVIISSKNFLKLLGSDFYDLMDNIRYLFNIEYIKRITLASCIYCLTEWMGSWGRFNMNTSSWQHQNFRYKVKSVCMYIHLR